MPMVMMNHAAYPHTPGKKEPGERVAVLDRDGAAQADRLSRDHSLRRPGDGRHSEVLPVDDAAVAAMRAGSDLVEICHSAELILRSYEALVAEARAIDGVSKASA